MSEAKIDINIEGGGAARTLGELREQAEQVNQALEGAELGSAEYKKLNGQLIQTTKQVKNLELGFESLDKEQVASEFGSVAGAIGDITSATILLGGENETIKEMAANIELALGVSMAFKGAIEGASSARKLWNDQMREGNRLYKIAIVMQKALNKATAANVLLIMAAAIGAVVAAILLWGKSATVAEQAQEDLNEASAAGTIAAGKEEAKLKVLTTALLGAAKGTEARVTALKNLNDVIPDSIGFITEETIATGEAVKVIGEYIKLVKQRAELAALEDVLSEKIADRVKAEMQLRTETNSLAQTALQKVINDSKEYENIVLGTIGGLQQNLAVTESTNKAMVRGTTVRKESNRVAKETTEIVEDNSEALAKEQEELDAYAAKLERQNQRKIDAYIKEQEELEALNLRKVEAADRLNKILRDKDADEFELRKNLLTERHEGELELLSELIPEENALKLELEAQYQEDLKEIERDADQAKRDARQQQVDDTIADAEKVLGIAESLNSSFHGKELARIKQKQDAGIKLTKAEEKRLRKEAQIQKAFALAQIAIDTAKGVSGAIAAGAGVPFPGNLIAIATGIASVLAGIAQASALLGGGGANISIPDATPAASDTGGGDNAAPVIDQFSTGSSLLNQPNKVIVVESDITSVQNNVASIEQSFTYG